MRQLLWQQGASSQPTIASAWEKLQSARYYFIRAERDRSRCHSAHRGGLELGTGTGLYFFLPTPPNLLGANILVLLLTQRKPGLSPYG